MLHVIWFLAWAWFLSALGQLLLARGLQLEDPRPRSEANRGRARKEPSAMHRPNLVIDPPGPRAREQLARWLDENRAAPRRSPETGGGQPIPAELLPGLVFLAAALARGQSVAMVPFEARLTTQQAAGILGVTRPTVVRLLEAGRIPFERCGSHRRIRPRDLFHYQAQASSTAAGSVRTDPRTALDPAASRRPVGRPQRAEDCPAVASWDQGTGQRRAGRCDERSSYDPPR